LPDFIMIRAILPAEATASAQWKMAQAVKEVSGAQPDPVSSVLERSTILIQLYRKRPFKGLPMAF